MTCGSDKEGQPGVEEVRRVGAAAPHLACLSEDKEGKWQLLASLWPVGYEWQLLSFPLSKESGELLASIWASGRQEGPRGFSCFGWLRLLSLIFKPLTQLKVFVYYWNM